MVVVFGGLPNEPKIVIIVTRYYERFSANEGDIGWYTEVIKTMWLLLINY